MTTRRIMAFGLIAAASAAAPARAQTVYDGVWNVTILTRAGNCEPSLRYPLTIVGGKVSGAADVSGSIGRDGIVRVSIRGAYANGQLNGMADLADGTGLPAESPAAAAGEASRQ
jgi:hypothetical protein